MDYPRDNVFTFLFSTYRRTAGVAFTAILIAAVPITIALLSNQQDIRQRAAEGGEVCAARITRARNTLTNKCRDFPSACLPAGWVADPTCQLVFVSPTVTKTLSPTPTTASNLRVFASSSRHKANFGGLAQADGICQQLATAANLGGTWKAWLSDSSTNAKDRISDGKYVRLDNSTIANSKADMIDGSLSSSISRDERGRRIEDQESVWTGTKRDGTKHEAACSNWTASNSTGRRGSASQRDEDWTDDGSQSCDRSLRIYCFEQGESPSPTGTTITPTATATPTPTPLLPGQKVFDFNDDGKVDEIDLNIMYAGFAKRQGD